MSKFIKKAVFLLTKNIIVFLFLPFHLCGAAARLPENFSFLTCESLDLPQVYAEKVASSPVLDGNISCNEYGEKSVFLPSAGLVFSTENSTNVGDQVQSFHPIEESAFVSYDDEYFYIAIEIFDPEGGFKLYEHNLHGKVFSVSIFIGVAGDSDLVSRQAVLNNCYYFTADSLPAIAMSGMRLKQQGESLKSVFQVSSYTKAFQNNGYKDHRDLLWNGKKYCEEAVALLKDENKRMAFECRIPIGDVLLCLDEEKREVSLDALKNSDSFVGSFMSRVSVNSLSDSSPLYVTSGIATRSVCPFSQAQETWNEVLISDFGIPKETSYSIDWLMTPLVFGPNVESEDDNAHANVDRKPEPKKNDVDEKPSPEKEKESCPPVSSTASAPVFEGEEEFFTKGSFEDESVFDDLPDAEDSLPEWTEIIPIDPEEEKDETGDIFGSLLPLFAGILMLISVCVVAFVFFKKEKEEINAKKSKRRV